jgi:hypothetical protein
MKKGSVYITTEQDTITHWPCDEREAFNKFEEFTEMPISGDFPIFCLSMSAPDQAKITTVGLNVDRLPHGFAVEVVVPRYLFGLIPFFPMMYQAIDKSGVQRDVVQEVFRLMFSGSTKELANSLSRQHSLEKTQ